MKSPLLLLSLLYLSTSSPEPAILTLGSECANAGGAYINSFFISPYPPKSCVAQSVQMIATFENNFCIKQILINEVYNMQQTFNQAISINQCFNKNEQVTFSFEVNPFQCTSGNYLIQALIQTNVVPATDLSCWQYSYTL